MADAPGAARDSLAGWCAALAMDIPQENAILLALVERKSFPFGNVSCLDFETSVMRWAFCIAGRSNRTPYLGKENSKGMSMRRWYSCSEHIPAAGWNNDTFSKITLMETGGRVIYRRSVVHHLYPDTGYQQ